MRTPRLGLLATLVLMGCQGALTPDAGPPDTGCSGAHGTLRVCIYGDASSTTTLSGGTVTARRDETDVPWLMRAGDDGCTEELVEVGTWQVSANDASGTCPTPFESVEVPACAIVEHRADVLLSCVDG